MTALQLRGITWNHSRALPPLVAASQRFEELHPAIRIDWEKRTLDEFGHRDLASLARNYDLLIIDHPMLGTAHRDRILTDLLPFLTRQELADLDSDALGLCLASYRYEGCLYALPVDAAAPAASFRSDLLERSGHGVPATWEQLIELARRGLARMPAFPADLFLNLMAMCASRGSPVALQGELFDHGVAMRCLEELQELASLMPDSIYTLNPIGIYEEMSSGDEFAYCPFAYTYSNYSRPGFAASLVTFANPVPLPGGIPLRTVLGGTGIAISTQCQLKDAAIEFCKFVSGYNCQTHLYGMCGGQPASNAAWHNPMLNRIANDFFERTLASVQTAFLRPRYAGYIALQREAGHHVAAFLRRETTADRTLRRLDELYRLSSAVTQGEPEMIP
jgi:multiple sugar transport system substrate-binding protein